jgi:ATP-binding cassette subfamily B protein
MDVRIGLIAFATIIVYLLVTDASQKFSEKAGPARQIAQESLVEAVLEYVQGMSVVKSYGLAKDSGQNVQKTIDQSHNKNLKLEYTACPWMALQQLIVRLGSIAIAAVTLIFFSSGSMNLANCLLMLISSFLVFTNLEGAGNMSAMLQMLKHSMDKADAIDNTPVMDIDGKNVVVKDSSIVFEHVSFSYGDKKILDDVNLQIPAKTTTAIVGPSGGGKTTMCNLIARFWDTEQGKIILGGTNVKDYKLDSLMQNISMVFQNVYLFQDTIENNIKFGKQNAAHEEVVAVAKKACCHNFISQLPDGYNTVIGEGGGSLSGGEKQRISIARAMLKNAPIILLDEATASVDPENEAELQNAIEALTHDKTIVMIAHRLKTVRHADQIVVLSGGHIVEQGTHEELKKQNGLYSDFLHAREEAIGWKLA